MIGGMMPLMMIPMLAGGQLGSAGSLTGANPGSLASAQLGGVNTPISGVPAGVQNVASGAGGAGPTQPVPGAVTQPASVRSAGDSIPAGSNTDVKLPDGTGARAPNGQEATPARAALAGATLADTGQQAGAALSPLSALNRRSGRAGKSADLRRRGAKRPSGDGDQDSDQSRRQ
jgi:hypothetical protein